MDSLTIQAVNNSLIAAVGEKLLQAELQNVPPQMVIKSGENIILQVLMDNSVPLSPLHEATLVIENKEIPVQIKTEFPLQSEQKPVADIIAKAVGRTEQGALPIQIVSVNGQKAETYLSAIRQENLPTRNDVPLWVNKTGEMPQIELLPLRLAPVVDKLASTASLPPEVKEQVLATVRQLELPLQVKALAPQPPDADTLLKPLQQVIDDFIQLPDALRARMPLPKDVLTVLQSFSGKEIPAVVQTKGEGNIPVLSTALGDVLPETPLKMPVGTPVMLQIGNITEKPVFNNVEAELPIAKAAEPMPVAEENIKLPAELTETGFKSQPQAPIEELLTKLSDILPPEKLPIAAKALPDILRPDGKEIFSVSSREMPPLLKVLEPIISDAQAVQSIVNKLPAVNNKLLSNIVGFVKAAESGEVKDWLGNTTVDRIVAKGAEGTETLSRLTQYVTTNVREGVVWRTVEIPFWGEGISMVKLAVKKKKQDKDSDNQPSPHKKEARFVLETEFSKLGKFQFDGFSVVNERRFDLIIRTSKMLPDDFCAHVVNLFKTSLHAVDYHGNIKLNLKENFIKIADDEPDNISIKDGLYI